MKVVKKYRAVFIEKKVGAPVREQIITATSGVAAWNMARTTARLCNMRLYNIALN